MIIDPDESSSPIPASTGPDLEQSTRDRRAWLAAMTAGLLAVAVDWPAGEAAVKYIRTEKDVANVNGREQAIVTVLSSNRSDVKRATLAYGLQGAILGLALGLAGAAVRRSANTVPAAALAGLIGGGVAGSGLSFGLFPILFRQLDPISGDLVLPMIIHVAVWSVVGAAVGLAFGIGRRGGPVRIGRAVLGGLLGAALGAVAYQLLGAFFFPTAKSDMPIAAGAAARLLGLALTGLSTAAGVAIADRPARHPTDRPHQGLVENHKPLTV
jgi:hypothetical protein